MSIRNKVFYFLLGALFAGLIGWNLSRPVEAVAPSRVERKVDVLSDRELTRMQNDIAALEKSIQDDQNFLASHDIGSAGKGGWSSQHVERRNTVEENLPAKQRRLEELRAQTQTLRM